MHPAAASAPGRLAVSSAPLLPTAYMQHASADSVAMNTYPPDLQFPTAHPLLHLQQVCCMLL